MKIKLLCLLTFLIASISSAQCDYTLELTDNFGSEWDSGANLAANAGVDITLNGTTTTYLVVNPSAVPNTPVVENYTISVNDGDALDIDYRATFFPGDAGFRFLDSEGIEVYASPFSQGSMMDIYVDTATCPTCFAVTQLTTNTVTATSADIGWTATGTEIAWEVEYGPVGFIPGAGTTDNATSNPWNITGLMSSTPYDVYVRADCGMGDISSNQGPISFTTTESCPSPSNFDSIAESAFDIQFTWDANGNSSINNQVNYDVSPFVQSPGTGQFANGNFGNFALIDNLMSATTYDFYVRYDCGMGDFSLWEGPYTATTAISCPEVTGIQADVITDNSLDVSWTAGGAETEWEVEYAPAGIITAPFSTLAQGTRINGLSIPSTPITGLTDATVYDVFVRAFCDPMLPDYSAPTQLTVTTLCLEFTPTSSAPYFQDFESFPAAFGFTEELCWTGAAVDSYDWNIDDNGGTPSGGTGPNAAFSGTNYFYTEASGGTAGTSIATLTGPQFNLSGLTNPSVQFYYHMFGGQIGDLILEVDDFSGSGWTAVNTISGAQQTAQGDAWLLQIVSLGAYAGQTVQIRFRAISGGSFEGDIALDDFSVGELPACPDSSLLTTDAISQSTADLSWSENGLATSWEVEVQPTGVAQGTLGAAYENLTSTNPETATGLTPQTTYDYFVRANCGIDGFSSWAGPYTFTTLCDAVVAPYSEDFELGFTPTTSGFPGAADAFSIENCYTAVNTNYFWVMAPGTLTASGGTGPDVSITTGNYFYAEGSSGTTGAIAELVTPLFDSSALTLPSVGFDYHMAGADMGSLEVLVRSGATDTVVATLTGPQQAADTDSYVNLNIALNAFAGQSFQIVFRATRGTGFTSDIAIDNLTIDESPSCPSPLGLTVDSAATDTITLSWVNGGSETAWEIEYVVAGAAQGTGTVVPASVNPFTITSLTANTSYEFYLRAVCAVGDESIWLGPTAGRTNCVAFAVPFTEGFNSTSTTQECWTVLDANGDGDQWTLDYAFNSSEGDQVAAISTDFNAGNDDDYLISPAISLTGIDRLRYEYRVQSVGEPNEMEVLISTTGNSAADFTTTLLPVTLYSNITYVEEVIDLSAYTGDVYVAWRIPPTSTDGWRMYIDNVRFEVIPGCDEPIALTTSGATTTSIDITFTERGTATAWEVEYGTSGFVLGSGTNVSAPSNPFTLTGLIPGSCYDYYIRSSCPSGGFSPWSPVSNFCTLCLAFDVPFQEGFNSTSTTQQCWTVLDVNADGDEWNLDYVTSPFEGDQSANINTDFNGGVDNDYLISPQINLTAAGQRLKYHFRVQSANEPNNMEILLSTTGIDPADFSNVLLPVTAYANTTYQEQIINLSAFTGPVFIAWRIPPTALDGWRVYIDDVIVEDNPSCVQPDMLAADTVTTTTANFSWNETGTATVWNVEVQPVGVAQGTAGAIYQNLTATSPEGITGLISNTSYDFYVRSDCGNGGVSVFSGPLTVTTAAACGDVVYDTGGSTGDYQNNESYTITYTPDTIANVATLDFTLVDVEGCCDTIKIYDGSDITAPVLESDLESPASFTASNLDGAITVQFTSDGSVVGAGWVANFTCIPRPSCINVTALTLDNTTADTLTVSWTDNNVPTSTDWEVVAVPTGDPAPAIGISNVTVIPFTITGLTAQTTYDVYVRSDCSVVFVGPIAGTTACDVVTQFPYVTDFTTNVPNQCWDEAGSGEIADGPLTRGASDWKANRSYENVSGTAVPSNVINLWQNVDREWLISEVYDMTGTSNDLLTVEVAVTDYLFTGASTAADTAVMGSDDQVDLLITTDGGVTWTSLTTWNAANQPATVGTSFSIDLSSYSGVVQFAFLASDGTVDDTEDYDFHVGSFVIDGTAGSNDMDSFEFNYYPNPTNSLVNFNGQQVIDGITVRNLLGQQLLVAKPNATSTSIDLSSFPSGLYLIEVASGEQSRVVKVLRN